MTDQDLHLTLTCSDAVTSCVAVWSSHLVINSKRVNLRPMKMRGDRVFYNYFTKGRDVELKVLPSVSQKDSLRSPYRCLRP